MMVWLLIPPTYLVGLVMEDDESVYDNNNNNLETSNLCSALIPDIKHKNRQMNTDWSLGWKWT